MIYNSKLELALKVGGDIMGKKKNDNKIIDICGRTCKVHPSFRSKMTKQLVESGTELLQEDIKNCVCVFLLDDDSIEYPIHLYQVNLKQYKYYSN